MSSSSPFIENGRTGSSPRPAPAPPGGGAAPGGAGGPPGGGGGAAGGGGGRPGGGGVARGRRRLVGGGGGPGAGPRGRGPRRREGEPARHARLGEGDGARVWVEVAGDRGAFGGGRPAPGRGGV